MAIVQISRIQQRRGLEQDLPQLASGEFGWSTDTNRLYIGNGSIAENSPLPGENTEILTQYSIVNFTSGVTSTLANITANIGAISNSVSALQSTLPTNLTEIFGPTSSGTVTTITANNAVMTYTLVQGSYQRYGVLKMARYPGSTTVSYNEEYTETGTTDFVFSLNANTSQANVNYTTTTGTTLFYNVQSLS